MTNGREIALDVLLSVTRDGEYSHIALRDTLEKYQYLEKKERAFITRIVEGTLENMIRIDYIIDAFSNTRTAKMKPVILGILRSSVYQICFLDRVPDSAVCNEAVKLAGRRGFHSLKGFVNGVLRSIAREKDRISYPSREEDPLRYLSICYSIPEWILDQWIREYGIERAEKMAEASVRRAPLSVRIDSDRVSREALQKRIEAEGITAKAGEWEDVLYLADYDRMDQIPGFLEGLFYVQDVSSMMAVRTADPGEGGVVLDLCAAPGGKSIHAAQLMHGTGRVIARDLTAAKTALIEENVRRCRIENIVVETADARIFDRRMEESADIVIADLPCSGLGVLGRKKDIRYKMTIEKEEELAALQREILETAVRYVKRGGKLLYSTCTVHRAENEENAAWLLKNHGELRLLSQRQIFPGEQGNDGFFIACMEKIKDE